MAMEPEKAASPITDEEKWDILTRPEKLGEILIKQGKLTLAQLEDLVKQQENSGMPLGELILTKGIMSRADLLVALDWQHRTDQVIIDSLTEMMKTHKKEGPKPQE
jgi:hypothetical protein